MGAIVLTGSPKAFAAGADIKEMAGKSFVEAFSTNMFNEVRARVGWVFCFVLFCRGCRCGCRGVWVLFPFPVDSYARRALDGAPSVA